MGAFSNLVLIVGGDESDFVQPGSAIKLACLIFRELFEDCGKLALVSDRNAANRDIGSSDVTLIVVRVNGGIIMVDDATNCGWTRARDILMIADNQSIL